MPSKTTRVLSKDKMVACKHVCQGYRFFFTFVGATAMGGRRERMREGGTYDKYERKFAETFTHASYVCEDWPGACCCWGFGWEVIAWPTAGNWEPWIHELKFLTSNAKSSNIYSESYVRASRLYRRSSQIHSSASSSSSWLPPLGQETIPMSGQNPKAKLNPPFGWTQNSQGFLYIKKILFLDRMKWCSWI